GAIAWNWNTDLQDPVRRDILSREQMQELLRRSGIRNDDTIVLYGDNNNWFAAYAYWQLKLYGHKDVRLMNGGRKKWIAEGRPLVQEVPQPEPSDYVVQEVHPELRALQPFVLESIGKRPLVDVRSPQESNGEILAPPGMSETAPRAGHIPRATNGPWSMTVNEDATCTSRDELARLYQEAGLSPDAESTITYCRIGERSPPPWFVLKELLGYPDVRNYDGSWTEWGSMVGTPIENPAAS